MIPNITPDILRPYKSGHKKPSRKPVDMDGSSVSHTEVFPNPTSNLLTIRSKNNELINAVGIYSIDGAMVFNNQNIISNIFSFS